MYDLIQSVLTVTINVIAIAGFSGIAAHAVFTSHQRWMATNCPPVKRYAPMQEAGVAPINHIENEAIAPRQPIEAELAPVDDLWESPIATSAPRYWQHPSQSVEPVLMLMPATVEIKAVTPRKPRKPSSKPVSVEQLRKECALQGVDWRSGGDYGKSMKKAQMLAALR